MTNAFVFVSIYESDSVYEPAEGGYYVPELLLYRTSVPMKWKHARRYFRKLVEKYAQSYGAPVYMSASNHVLFHTGSGYNDTVEIRIERRAGEHEERYGGYC